MDLLIRYGPALRGLAVILLCFRPLSPSVPLGQVSWPLSLATEWQNVDPRSRVGLDLSWSCFWVLSALLWLSGGSASCQQRWCHAFLPTHAVVEHLMQRPVAGQLFFVRYPDGALRHQRICLATTAPGSVVGTQMATCKNGTPTTQEYTCAARRDSRCTLRIGSVCLSAG